MSETDICPSAPPVTYEDRIGGLLLSLPLDAVFEIAKQVKTENRPAFTACVKSYIDRNLGRDENWEIIFSNDYLRIKKQEIQLNHKTPKTWNRTNFPKLPRPAKTTTSPSPKP